MTTGVQLIKQDQVEIVEVENAFSRAEIALYGACVLSFKPKTASEDILWISPTAVYSGHKPIRGGIPICWPWFGAHPLESELPAHGFVRNMLWSLEDSEVLDSGATQVILSCESNNDTMAIWPHAFRLELCVEVAESLSITLTTFNLSDESMIITEALHSYFNVSQASDIQVHGLEGSTHMDKLSDAPAVEQTGVIHLVPPMDSVYVNHRGAAVIEDSGYQRNIRIDKQSSASSVVWNPGPEIVKGFNDIPHDQWQAFLCVEAGNIFENAVKIPAGQKHALTMQLSSQDL